MFVYEFQSNHPIVFYPMGLFKKSFQFKTKCDKLLS